VHINQKLFGKSLNKWLTNVQQNDFWCLSQAGAQLVPPMVDKLWHMSTSKEMIFFINLALKLRLESTVLMIILETLMN